MKIRLKFVDPAHVRTGNLGLVRDDLRADKILVEAGFMKGIYFHPRHLEQAKAVLRLNGFEIEESE